MQYLHACLFSPRIQTLLQAIKNNNMITWPGLTIRNVKKYMKETIATAKGHLDKNRKNLRSTKKTQAEYLQEIKYYETEAEDEEITPKREDKTNKVFASYLAQDKEEVIYQFQLE